MDEEKISRDKEALKNYGDKVDETQNKLNNLKNNLNDTSKEVDIQSKSFDETSKSLNKFGNNLKELGEITGIFGKGLYENITKPLTENIEVNIEFEASMSKVQASLNPTSEEFSQLEKKAIDMAASTTKTSKDIAEAFINMGRSGWEVQDILLGIEPIIHLSEAGNMDLAKSSNLVTKAMKAMEVGIVDLPGYLNLITKSAQSSNTDLGDMMESYISAGEIIKKLKVSSTDGAVGLGLLASAGEKGAQGGEKLTAILTSLTSPTNNAKKALEELNFTAFDSEGNFIGVENSIKNLNEKMSGMTDETRDMYISMIAGEENISDLNILLNGVSSDGFENFKEAIYENDNALENMRDVMQDNVKGSLMELQSSLSNIGSKIYEILKPAINDIIDILKTWAERLDNLSPRQQETITNIIKFGTIVGPVLIVIGKIIGLIGSLVLKLSMLSTMAAAMGTTLGTLISGFLAAAAPVVAIVAAIAGVGVGLYKLNENLKKSTLEIEVFDTSISKATKNSVESFLGMDDEISKSLLSLKTNAGDITQETADNIAKQYATMGNDVIGNLESQKTEAEKVLKNLFSNTEGLDGEEVNTKVQKITEGYDTEIKLIKSYEEETKNIVDTAAKEKRQITDEENTRLIQIQEEIRTAGVRSLSETEAESKVILQNLKDNRSGINAEILSDVVKSSLEQKNQAVETAQSEYEEIIRIAEQTRAQGGEVNGQRADELIKLAQEQRDETIKTAEETHQGVISEAKLQSEEHVNQINWETGEVLTSWDLFKDLLKEKFDKFKFENAELIETLLEIWNDLKEIFSKVVELIQIILEGFINRSKEVWNLYGEDIKNIVDTAFNLILGIIKTVTGIISGVLDVFIGVITGDWSRMGEGLKKIWQTAWDGIKIIVDGAWGLLKGSFSILKTSITNFFAELIKNFIGFGKLLMEGLKKGITNFVIKPINAIKEAGEKIKNKAKSVFKIHSPSKVFEEDGRFLMEGWAVGIEKNSKLAENALEKAAEALKNTSNNLDINPNIKLSVDDIKDNVSGVFGKNKSLDEYGDYLRKLNADELDLTLKHLEELRIARENALNKQIDSTVNNKTKDNLRTEKNALLEHNGEIRKIIDDRIRSLDEQSQKESNVLSDRLNQYDNSIKNLKIKTNDLNDELSNNAAIVILQSEKVEYLSKQYDRLVDSFGFTAKESQNVKKSLEDARLELVQMQEEVEKTNEKIKNQTMDSINNLHKTLMSAIKKRYEEEGKIKEEALKKEIEDLDRWKDESIKRINDVYDKKIKRIDDVANFQIKAIEDELKAMEKQEEKQSRDKTSDEYNRNIKGLEESIFYEHDEYNKSELEKKLAEEKSKFLEQQEAWTLEDKKAKLKEKIDIIKENAAEEKEILSIQKQEELERIDGLYTFEREVLESKMNDNRDFLQQMTDDKQLQAEAEKMILNTQQQDMLDLLKQYEPGYEKAGYNLGQKLVDGVAPQIQKVIDMMNYMYMTLGLDNKISISDHIRVQNKQMKEFRPPEVIYRDSANLFGNNEYKLPEKTINNTVNINSPKALDPSEQRKLYERQMNKLSFNI